MRKALHLILFVCPAYSCTREIPQEAWTRREAGHYYRLLSFEAMERKNQDAEFAWLDLSFCTLDDSVFWDSRSNYHDRFFMRLSPMDGDVLRQELLGAAEADSFCILEEPAGFFRRRFVMEEVPGFCAGDSAVKVFVKVRDLVSGAAFDSLAPLLAKREGEEIAAWLGNAGRSKVVADAQGIYWIATGGTAERSLKKGDEVNVSYRGYFLSGRVADEGEAGFRLTWGDPSQLIAGPNNVMAALKPGQNAKIIIPSRLAYGDHGSSTGLVPPFTPLLYEIE